MIAVCTPNPQALSLVVLETITQVFYLRSATYGSTKTRPIPKGSGKKFYWRGWYRGCRQSRRMTMMHHSGVVRHGHRQRHFNWYFRNILLKIKLRWINRLSTFLFNKMQYIKLLKICARYNSIGGYTTKQINKRI